MTTYTEPKTEDLARLAAEAMGWKWGRCCTGEMSWMKSNGAFGHDLSFEPQESHDHAQIMVDEAFKRGLGRQYIKHLCDELDVRNAGILDFGNAAALSIALPETKTRAFLRAIHESPPCK